ncbi:MAG TPA: hypothetical protein VM848_08065 [Acidimicrobiia bacterium]|nr:hypothetical protein [Acidimicrobiia bacterium]
MLFLTRTDISTQLVAFADGEGRHIHDADPRFQAWNEMADAFQIAPPIVTGDDVIINAGEGSRKGSGGLTDEDVRLSQLVRIDQLHPALGCQQDLF